MSYKSVWDFGRSGGITNYSVHSIGEYPSKIRPLVFHEIVKRFSDVGDIILDPFCGCGTMGVEAKILGRHSINYDINENAVNLTREKLSKLTREEIEKVYEYFINELEKEKRNKEVERIDKKIDELKLIINGITEKELKNTYKSLIEDFEEIKKKEEASKLRKVQIDKEIAKYKKLKEEIIDLETKHISEIGDARTIDYLQDLQKISPNKNFFDAIITDIPYANMIKYSDLKDDLSNIEDYDNFINELSTSFKKMTDVLKKEGYCVVFVADYRVGASRKILPIHVDVVNIMRDLGLTLFDTYIWRYYRSGGFRPFGKKPFQAMNIHTYILVFHKPDGEELNKKNSEVKYRKRLIEKMNNNNHN